MFKKIISSVIIISLLWTDVAFCGNGSRKPLREEIEEDRDRTPSPRSPRIPSQPINTTRVDERSRLLQGQFSTNENDAIPTLAPGTFFEAPLENKEPQSVSHTPSQFSLKERIGGFIQWIGGRKTAPASTKPENPLVQEEEGSTDREDAASGNSTQAPAPKAKRRFNDQTTTEDEGALRGASSKPENGENSEDETSWHFLPPQSGSSSAGVPILVNPKTGKQKSLAPVIINVSDQSPLLNGEDGETAIVRLPSFEIKDLSPEARRFLIHVKKRIIDGELNKKQKAGIAVGVLTGAAVAWPLMLILYDPILKFYFAQALSLEFVSNSLSDFSALNQLMEDFSKEVTFYTMLGGVGIPLGIDAASRTSTILYDFTGETLEPFSLPKSKKHKMWLILSRGGAYGGAFVAASLPTYYLFQTLLGCNVIGYINILGTGDSYYSPNIFFIISNTNVSDGCYNSITDSTSLLRTNLPPENIVLFTVGAFFLTLDTLLQYGHQLSHHIEQWINAHFFRKIRKGFPLSPTEIKRRDYRTQLKDLKHMIYVLEEENLSDLYEKILVNGFKSRSQEGKINAEEITLNETLRVFQILQKMHREYIPSIESEEVEDCEDLKRTCSSRLGTGLSLIATAGRGYVFWYIINALMNNFNSLDSVNFTLSFIFGSIIANIVQGWVEKDAVQESVYDLSRGKKIPEGTSHKSLRLGIKIWDGIYGIFNTAPYVYVGTIAIGLYNGSTPINFSSLATWEDLALITTFCFADIFNNATGFNQSYLGLVNAADSSLSYCCPSQGYKQDKLIRVTRQLRRLFKDLRPEVLEEIDQKLNKANAQIPTVEPEEEESTEELS